MIWYDMCIILYIYIHLNEWLQAWKSLPALNKWCFCLDDDTSVGIYASSIDPRALWRKGFLLVGNILRTLRGNWSLTSRTCLPNQKKLKLVVKPHLLKNMRTSVHIGLLSPRIRNQDENIHRAPPKAISYLLESYEKGPGKTPQLAAHWEYWSG